MRLLGSQGGSPGFGKEVDEVFAGFEASCQAKISPARMRNVRRWLERIPPGEREEAIRILWFKVDEVDRRANHLHMTLLRALGAEKIRENQDHAAPVGEETAEDIERRLEELDRAIGHSKRTIEAGAHLLETRWPKIVRTHGDPLGHPPLPPVVPISLEFGSAPEPLSAEDLQEVRVRISRERRGLGSPSKRVGPPRNAVERWLASRYYRKKLGPLSQEFIDFEAELSTDIESAEYARRVFEWLMAMSGEDRAHALDLAKKRTDFRPEVASRVAAVLLILDTANRWEATIHQLETELAKCAPETKETAILGADLTAAEFHYEAVMEDLDLRARFLSAEHLAFVDEWSVLCRRYGEL
ncbi:MAG TPA: hypothetical protein VMI31_02355 [Fimbriimonadaceae bacterium]|nr:hypothetical protein [Fimbriimonadaceae bacterium]